MKKILIKNRTLSFLEAINANTKWSRFVAIEIGNEPDLYFENKIRSPNYTYNDYAKEWKNYVNSILKDSNINLPSNKFFQGATYCCKKDFFDEIDTYVSSNKNYLHSLSIHAYAQSACDNKKPTLEQLLSQESIEGRAQELKQYSTFADSHGGNN